MRRFSYGAFTIFVALMLLTDRGWSLDGVCGAANGTSLPFAPTANLCSSGSPSSVAGHGPWTWRCMGNNGGATASCTANTANRLSINLAGIAFYSTQIPFKDLMFQAVMNPNYVGGGSCSAPPTDDDGYALSLAPGCVQQWLVVPGAPIPPGHYVLTYSGTGTGYVGGDAVNVQFTGAGRAEFDVQTSQNGIIVEITSTDPANHLRDIHVFLVQDEATYQVQPFRQQFLDLLAPFRIIRFMDWSGVSIQKRVATFISDSILQPDAYTIVLPPSASNINDAYANHVAIVNVGDQWPRLWVDRYDGATRTLHLASPAPVGVVKGVYLQDFPNRTWDKRTPLSNRKQEGPSGVAFEYMVNLANTTDKDFWLTVPTAADDDFVVQLATLLKNTLNPNLKIYIEYSNETWNVGYPGYDYSEAIQRKSGLGGSPVLVPADAWHPYRALQIFHLFNQVFGEADLRINRDPNSRLVRVLTGQTGWPARLGPVVDWTNTGNSAPTYGRPAYEYADAVAVTGYWGFPSAGFDPAIFQYPLAQFIDQMIQLQMQAIIEATSPTGSNDSNYLYLIAHAARARNIPIIQYEGGESFTVPDGDQTIVDKLDYMNRDPRMADVYSESLRRWQILSQTFPGTIGNWAQFNDVGACSRYGCWGLLDSTLQPLSNSPRYQGILNFLITNLRNPATF